MTFKFLASLFFAAAICMVQLSELSIASDIEKKPIEYGKRQGDNPVTQLKKKLEAGEVRLEYKAQVGYLPSLLKELRVPDETQTFVFSRTSLQRNRIAPRSPRALYFNDDIYIGYCRFGEVLEISVADPKLGTEFYTLSQDESKPQIVRHTESCLICHGGSPTHGLPGHLLRSVYTDEEGTPILSMGSHRVDPSTPWEKRFGGWYVTGKTSGLNGKQHLGNLIVQEKLSPEMVENSDGQNVVDLKERIHEDSYLHAHSDLASHLVLTHQLHVHNMLAKLSLETQSALYEERELNRELGEPNRKWESTQRRIQSHARDLVKAMFYYEESELPEKIEGTSGFVDMFAKRGPCDSKGRSLRELQLSKRLMKYPLSYLIYTESFTQLPVEAKKEVVSQIRGVLHPERIAKQAEENGTLGRYRDTDWSPNLSSEDRLAIDEILMETLPGWKE